MDLMEQLRERAKANVQKVAFFEGDNPKMMETVGELAKEGLADCYLVGDAAVLREVAAQVGVDLNNVTIVDVTDAEANEAFAQRFEVIPDCPFRAKGVRRRAKLLAGALRARRCGGGFPRTQGSSLCHRRHSRGVCRSCNTG